MVVWFSHGFSHGFGAHPMHFLHRAQVLLRRSGAQRQLRQQRAAGGGAFVERAPTDDFREGNLEQNGLGKFWGKLNIMMIITINQLLLI